MKERLESLDILRGADMFLLLFLGPILRAVCKLCPEGSYFIGDHSSCLLAHSVRYYHKKGSDQDPNIDEPCIFADYYFLEALYRYKTLGITHKNRIFVVQDR